MENNEITVIQLRLASDYEKAATEKLHILRNLTKQRLHITPFSYSIDPRGMTAVSVITSDILELAEAGLIEVIASSPSEHNIASVEKVSEPVVETVVEAETVEETPKTKKSSRKHNAAEQTESVKTDDATGEQNDSNIDLTLTEDQETNSGSMENSDTVVADDDSKSS